MSFIPKENERHLLTYKYSGVDNSLISQYILKHYWNRLVLLFPIWMAPNLITLSGFFCILINFATLAYFSPNLIELCPNWAYFSFAVGLFVYQSLDAIDGKQARRTGTSGPLGELFDHGCDALNTTLGIILGFSALGFPDLTFCWMGLFFALSNFYATTWEEYHTGSLFLSIINGPVEGVLMGVALFLWTSFAGPQFWQQNTYSVFPFLRNEYMSDRPLNEFICTIWFSTLLLNTLLSMWNVYKSKSSKGTTGTNPFYGLFPFLCTSGFIYAWITQSKDIILEHVFPFMMSFGLAFGYSVGLIILGHVTKQSFPYFNIGLIPFILGGMNALIPVIFEGKNNLFSKEVEIWFIYGTFLYELGLYIYFSLSVIHQVCQVLDIHCLTIKTKKVE